MNDPLVSVVIPAYNVGPYLNRALDSVSTQTYKSLDIIVINDGSKDDTLSVAEKYKEKDDRLTVINKPNGGLSSARNAGLDAAKGEYVFFMDSDDFIDPETIEVTVTSALKNGVKMVETGIRKVYPDGRTKESCAAGEMCFKGDGAIKHFLTDRRGMTSVAWDALYHISVFDKLRFETGRLHEDVWFKYKAIYYAAGMVVLPRALYNYVQKREGSIMTSGLKEKNVRDALDSYEDRVAFFKRENKPELNELAQASYYRELLSFYYLVWRDTAANDGRDQLLNDIREKLKGGKAFVAKSRALDGKWKAKYYLFIYFKSLAILIYRFKDRRR